MSSLRLRFWRFCLGGVISLAAVSCVSADKNLVANATASFMFHEEAYEWVCVGHQGPAECQPCYASLIHGRRQIKLANDVYKVGKMPKAESDGLKQLIRDLERCP